MTHPSTVLLSDYVSDELDGRERREVEIHIAGCARCHELVTGFRNVASWARNFDGTAESPAAWATVAAAIARYRLRRRLGRMALAAAAVLAFLTLSLMASRDREVGGSALSSAADVRAVIDDELETIDRALAQVTTLLDASPGDELLQRRHSALTLQRTELQLGASSFLRRTTLVIP